MFPVPDTLAAFYLVCFFVGLIFVAASLFLGMDHGDASGLDHAGGFDHAGATDGSSGDPSGVHGAGHVAGTHGLSHTGAHVSPINVSTIMAFLTWFGGAGYITHVYAGFLGTFSVIAATVAGLVGGAVVFFFLAKVLLPGQRFLDPADYRMVGTVARVSAQIAPNRVGEIVYARDGSRHSEGARSAEESVIERGTEVVIVRYERGIAYVEPWASYVAKG